MFQWEWTMSSNINNHYTLTSEHNWENMCIQLRNQHTWTFDNRNQNMGAPILNMIIIDYTATQVCWSWRLSTSFIILMIISLRQKGIMHAVKH